MSPAKGAISDDFSSYMKAMHHLREQFQQNKISSRKEADAYLAAHVEPQLGVRQFLLTNLQPSAEDKTKLDWRISLEHITPELDQGGIGDFPYDPQHSGHPVFNGPTLFLKGSKSKYINHKNEPTIKSFFPRAELKTLEAGHWGACMHAG